MHKSQFFEFEKSLLVERTPATLWTSANVFDGVGVVVDGAHDIAAPPKTESLIENLFVRKTFFGGRPFIEANPNLGDLTVVLHEPLTKFFFGFEKARLHTT